MISLGYKRVIEGKNLHLYKLKENIHNNPYENLRLNDVLHKYVFFDYKPSIIKLLQGQHPGWRLYYDDTFEIIPNKSFMKESVLSFDLIRFLFMTPSGKKLVTDGLVNEWEIDDPKKGFYYAVFYPQLIFLGSVIFSLIIISSLILNIIMKTIMNKLSFINLIRKFNIFRLYSHSVKIKCILDNSIYKSNFVETGTYFGDTISFIHESFDKCYTIELSNDLYKYNVDKFSKYENITFINGDAGKILKQLIFDIDGPIVYWLDGHFSGGITAKSDSNTPILAELNAIISRNNERDIIFIDDYNSFGYDKDYPSIESVKNLFINFNSNTIFKKQGNILIISFKH